MDENQANREAWNQNSWWDGPLVVAMVLAHPEMFNEKIVKQVREGLAKMNYDKEVNPNANP